MQKLPGSMIVLYDPLLSTCTVSEPALLPFCSIPLRVLRNVEDAVAVDPGCNVVQLVAVACACAVAEVA
jgi:hypothetical protein